MCTCTSPCDDIDSGNRVADILADHSDIIASTAPVSTHSDLEPSQLPLRQFFAELLTSNTSSHAQPSQTSSRRRLTSEGESLTSEEAISRIQTCTEEAAKQRKEMEKLERKRKKEEKKAQAQRKKQTISHSATPIPKPQTPRAQCIECEINILYDEDSGDEDWIECE